MAIPLFGFSPPTPTFQVQPRPVPDLGDRILNTFVPAFQDSFAREEQARIQAERDAQERTFQNRQREARQDFARSERKAGEQFSISRDIQTGARIPATDDNIAKLEFYGGREAVEAGLVTDPSTGERFIRPQIMQQIDEEQRRDFQTEPTFDEPFLRTLQTAAGQAGLDTPLFSPEQMANLTTGGGDGRLSPREVDTFDRQIQTTLALMGWSNDRIRNLAALRSASTKDPPDLTKMRQFAREYAAGHKFYITETGEDGVARRRELTPDESAQYAWNVARFEFTDELHSPAALAVLQDVEAVPHQTPEIWKESIIKRLREITSDREEARNFNQQLGRTVWARVREDPEGANYVKQTYFGAGARTDQINGANSVLAERIRQDPTLARATILMESFPTPEDYISHIRVYGGHQNFTDIFGPSVFAEAAKINPSVWGDFNPAGLSILAPPAAISGPGSLDPATGAAPGRLPSEQVPDSSDFSDEPSQSPTGALGATMEDVMHHRLLNDPNADVEWQEFVTAISNPDVGPDEVIRELEEVLTIVERSGNLGQNFNLQGYRLSLPEIRNYIQNNRAKAAQELPVLFQDAITRAQERVGQAP